MKRRDLQVATALIGLVVSGFAATSANAQQPGHRSEGAFIRAVHSAERTPRTAQIELVAESFATTAAGAAAANALVLQRVRGALIRAGVPAEDIQIHGYSLVPEYAPREIIPSTTIRDRAPRVSGYWAVDRISLTTYSPEQVGLLVDLARGAGANRLLGVHLY